MIYIYDDRSLEWSQILNFKLDTRKNLISVNFFQVRGSLKDSNMLTHIGSSSDLLLLAYLQKLCLSHSHCKISLHLKVKLPITRYFIRRLWQNLLKALKQYWIVDLAIKWVIFISSPCKLVERLKRLYLYIIRVIST